MECKLTSGQQPIPTKCQAMVIKKTKNAKYVCITRQCSNSPSKYFRLGHVYHFCWVHQKIARMDWNKIQIWNGPLPNVTLNENEEEEEESAQMDDLIGTVVRAKDIESELVLLENEIKHLTKTKTKIKKKNKKEKKIDESRDEREKEIIKKEGEEWKRRERKEKKEKEECLMEKQNKEEEFKEILEIQNQKQIKQKKEYENLKEEYEILQQEMDELKKEMEEQRRREEKMGESFEEIVSNNPELSQFLEELKKKAS